MIKTLIKLGIESNILNLTKGVYRKTYIANKKNQPYDIIYGVEILDTFRLRLKARQGWSLPPLLPLRHTGASSVRGMEGFGSKT